MMAGGPIISPTTRARSPGASAPAGFAAALGASAAGGGSAAEGAAWGPSHSSGGWPVSRASSGSPGGKYGTAGGAPSRGADGPYTGDVVSAAGPSQGFSTG